MTSSPSPLHPRKSAYSTDTLAFSLYAVYTRIILIYTIAVQRHCNILLLYRPCKDRVRIRTTATRRKKFISYPEKSSIRRLRQKRRFALDDKTRIADYLFLSIKTYYNFGNKGHKFKYIINRLLYIFLQTFVFFLFNFIRYLKVGFRVWSKCCIQVVRNIEVDEVVGVMQTL